MYNLCNKRPCYYSKLNGKVLKCIEGRDNIILDVGCGHGFTGKALKESRKAGYVVGVEINPEAAGVAAKNLDKVLCMNIENAGLMYHNYFDYIILCHVLEHLNDPLDVLVALRSALQDRGRIVVALPNIRYWRILRDLICFDKWEYREAGILDYDHKRFFTYTSAADLLGKAGYRILRGWLEINGPKQKAGNVLTGGIFERFFSSELYILASKT